MTTDSLHSAFLQHERTDRETSRIHALTGLAGLIDAVSRCADAAQPVLSQLSHKVGEVRRGSLPVLSTEEGERFEFARCRPGRR